MNKSLFLATCAAAMTIGAADAAIINITVDTAGVLLNGAGTANSSQANMPPNNPTRTLAFLNRQISLWNAVYDPDLSVAVSTGLYDTGSLSGDTYEALSGYNYVVFHFGNGNAGGSPGGWFQAWYLGGLGGSFSAPSVGAASAGEFSSGRYFNPVSVAPRVPDSGITIALLGMGVILVEYLRRKGANV